MLGPYSQVVRSSLSWQTGHSEKRRKNQMGFGLITLVSQRPPLFLWAFKKPLVDIQWNTWSPYVNGPVISLWVYRLPIRKSLRSWRLGGDLWVLKLATCLIHKQCVWAVFCFSLGLKYRQSNIDIGHPDLLPYAWWFLCPRLCFLFPRQF